MLRNAAVITLLLTKLAGFVVAHKFYASFIENMFDDSYFLGWEHRVRTTLMLLMELLELILIVITLFAHTVTLRDKSYKLLRIIFVVYFLFELPYYIAGYFGLGDFASEWLMILSLVILGAKIFCLVAFIRASPLLPLAKVNLADFELVTNTSTGHRFVHGLLDTLIMMPQLLQLSQGTYYEGYGPGMQVLSVALFYGSYFIYYTVSESLFGQTFGKVFTNSCVVGHGKTLTTGQIVMRSLFRYIPVDAFTFLAGANWHDKLSSTAVVYVNSWENAFAEVGHEEETAQKPV